MEKDIQLDLEDNNLKFYDENNFATYALTYGLDDIWGKNKAIPRINGPSSGIRIVPSKFDLSEIIEPYDNDNWDLVVFTIIIFILVLLILPLLFTLKEIYNVFNPKQNRVVPIIPPEVQDDHAEDYLLQGDENYMTSIGTQVKPMDVDEDIDSADLQPQYSKENLDSDKLADQITNDVPNDGSNIAEDQLEEVDKDNSEPQIVGKRLKRCKDKCIQTSEDENDPLPPLRLFPSTNADHGQEEMEQFEEKQPERDKTEIVLQEYGILSMANFAQAETAYHSRPYDSQHPDTSEQSEFIRRRCP